ncbi:LacI family DNA-binding transcriptional regulator [Shouchella lehensis]|uniref:LacI family transcriptional regulator n=1 Tax=Shouchella lehensis TaxID=300825 RepID=A0A4Y7WJT8_9BACI|nr:LacI family DNA-binding transcriptional regulator [Shouchella lehensis]MBG9786028.1 LacI family transcriptional regulator [Shouchella lehensis]TES48506.1 LacI family transcriptional regulator [Shouchella lehensis]
MKPKISDVAHAAGVSPTTVSRVLNNRGYISEDTKKKVYKAMDALNYIPNDLARSLYNKRSNIIGVIVPTTSNPFYGELAAKIEHHCAEKGLKVLLCNSLFNVEKERNYWEMLRRNQVDGVIVCTYNRGLIDYDDHHLPIVAFDHYLSKRIPVVSSTNYEGGVLATNHLVQTGCQKIVHINGPIDLETPANLRRKAYEDVMKKQGLPVLTYEIKPILKQEATAKAVAHIFDEQQDMDGVFASDDSIALAVIREARERGVLVPDNLKVIGYDGSEFVREIAPELTTIQQPINQMAETAVNHLLHQIEGTTPIPNQELVHHVLLRKGTSA